MRRTFKQMLSAGETMCVFAIARVMHPMLIEVFARAGGFDGFWLDQEHATVSAEQITYTALAARANGMDMFVRMPPTGYWQVTQCLEAGAGGVMAADSFGRARRQFASWAKFAPEGDARPEQ